MEKLNVRFSDTTKLKINDIANVVGVSDSKVARAAMKLGIERLLSLSARDRFDASIYIDQLDRESK